MTKDIKLVLHRNQNGVVLEEGIGFTNDKSNVKIPKNSKILIVDFSTYDNTVQIRGEHNNVVFNVYVSYDFIINKCVMNTENNFRIDSIFVYKEGRMFSWFTELLTPMSLALISNIVAIISLVIIACR